MDVRCTLAMRRWKPCRLVASTLIGLLMFAAALAGHLHDGDEPAPVSCAICIVLHRTPATTPEPSDIERPTAPWCPVLATIADGPRVGAPRMTRGRAPPSIDEAPAV
jgi:hypothetical protein